METLSFVIVGHIDHGKSTLIGRLLYDTNSLPPDKIQEIQVTAQGMGKETEFSYLLDHLEEERQQGITIETTQVFFNSANRSYVIIDAPGHVEFVKNMITGASHAEAAVVIIDAQEGVKEQTKRHAYILSLLGIQQVIVVVNKMDLVGYSKERFDQLCQETASFLHDINIESKSFVPISALKGENITKPAEMMPWYEGVTFLSGLDSLEKQIPVEKKECVFPIQDVYKVDDKRIIAGRLETGSLQSGESIVILPHQQTTKIATIEKYPESVNKAYAGESIGITTVDAVFSNRGDIICHDAGEVHFTHRFAATVIWLTKRGFTIDERLILKCATQQSICAIEAIKKRIDSSTLKTIAEDTHSLSNLEVAEVIIKTKKEIAITLFDDVQELGRFVLVRDDNTCAGGIVTKFL